MESEIKRNQNWKPVIGAFGKEFAVYIDEYVKIAIDGDKNKQWRQYYKGADLPEKQENWKEWFDDRAWSALQIHSDEVGESHKPHWSGGEFQKYDEWRYADALSGFYNSITKDGRIV